MKRGLFCAFIVILAVALNILVFLKGQNLIDSAIEVAVELEMDSNADVQLMYSDGIFDLEHVSTQHYQTDEGRQSLVFNVPTGYTAWRLDFGEGCTDIKIYSIKISNGKTEKDVSLDSVITGDNNDIDNAVILDNICMITVAGEDPYSILDMSKVNLNQILNDMCMTKSLIAKALLCLVFDILLICMLRRFNSLCTSLGEMIQSRTLILNLAKNDFKSKYVGSFLGMLWAFIRPIITVLVYWFVFQVGLGSGDVNGSPFVLWLLTGLVPWFFFSDALGSGTAALIEYQYLVKKIVFKISTIPVVKVVSSLFVHLFFTMLPIIVYCCCGNAPHLYMLQLIYYMICLTVFLTALLYFTSSVALFFKDTMQIIGVILEVGIWLTPIMWQLTLIPEQFRWLFKLNPMYYIVYGYRDSIISKVWFWDKLYMTGYFWGVTILLFIGGIRIFNKLKVHFADVL